MLMNAQYIIPSYATFASEWEKLASASAATETFALSSSESLRDACKSLIEGMWIRPVIDGADDDSTEHGGSWRYRDAGIKHRPHPQSLWYCLGRWRKGSCSLSDDVPVGCRRHARVGR